MFNCKSDLFEITENEEIFKEICDKLKHHPFESPWRMCFEAPEEVNGVSCEVREITLPEINEINISISTPMKEQIEDQFIPIPVSSESPIKDDFNEIDNMKLADLKDALMTVQENSTIENIKGIEILHTLNLSQVPKLCRILSGISLSDTAATLFLNAISTFETPLSLSLASSLVKCIVYPQVFENKMKHNGSRNLLAAVLNFSEVYPKAMIDDVIVPCVKSLSLEPLQLETLLKMTKASLPTEYVSYCVKNILEQALAVESTFTLLQNLIERKVHLEQQLHDKLAWKVENWTITHNKNVKFTKLLISVLTVYGNELEDKQIVIYRDTIRSNETIMKKAAENALKKLTKI